MKPLLSQIIRRRVTSPVSNLHLHLSQSRRWGGNFGTRKDTRFSATRARMENNINNNEVEDYSSWTNEKLVDRVTQLEAELKSKNNR